MNFQYLDLFSTQFQFNVGLKQMRKRSKMGALLSITVVAIFLIYFVYLLFLYIGNQIDPKYKMQAFITDESIQVDLHNDLLAFRYEYQNNAPLEELEQKTAFLYVSSQDYFQFIELNVIQCQNKNLHGYNCLDFSKASNYTLHVDGKQNILNNIFIAVYRCQDTDIYKQTIPDNCASPEEIDTMINDPNTLFKMKLYTSQYNTVSEQIQSSYKNVYMNIQGDDFLFTRFKTVKQTTTVKKGPFIQQQTSFSSPIDYIKEERTFNRKGVIEKSGLTLNLQITIDIDEQVQIIQIQYATFMEILAICNSTLTILMGVGIVGRYFANQLIREDIQLLLFQNLYQQQYLNILKKCNIFQSKIQLKEVRKEKSSEDVIENTDQIFIPSFITKSRETVDLAQSNFNSFPLDFVITNNKQYCDKQQNYYDSEEKKNNNGFNAESIQESFRIQSPVNIKCQEDCSILSHNFQINLNEKQSKKKNISQQFYPKIRIIETDNESLTSSQTEQIESPQSKHNIKKIQLIYKKQSSNFSSSLKLRQAYKSSKNNTKEEISQPIETEKCLENLKVIYDNQYGNKFQNLNLKLNIFKRLASQQKRQLDPLLHQMIDEQVNKNLDILQLYKDIIILKKAMMMILSKEQFAAIQLIGFSDNFYSSQKFNRIDRNINVDSEYQKQNKEFGYLDEQQMISQSLESQLEYVDKFLKRISNNEDISSIDQRIYSSLTLK